MTERRRFEAVVALRDQTAGPLAGLQARLAALAGSRAIGAVSGAARAAAAAVAGFVSSFGPLGAIAGGGSAAALVAMANATAELALSLSKASRESGVAAERLQALQDAARIAGAGPEQMTAAMAKLRDVMRDAAAGRNADVASLFKAMRLPLRDANGQLRQAADVLPQIATSFSRTRDPALRARMALALFGDAGKDLLPLLERGGSDLRGLLRQLEALDGRVNAQTTPALLAFREATLKVEVAARGIRNEIANRLAPVLTPLVDRLTEFLHRNRDLIATTLAAWFENLARAVGSIDLKAVLDGFEAWGATVVKVVKLLGGLQGAMLAVAAVLAAPFLASVVNIVAALAKLSVVLLALPFAKVIAAAALLAAGALAVYENWDLVVQLFERLDRIWSTWSGRGQAVPIPVPDFAPSPGGRSGGGLMTPPPGLFDRPPGDSSAVPGGPSSNPLLRRQSFSPAAELPAGVVEVRVRFDDLPPGARADARARGPLLAPPQLEVGYARLGAVPA